MLFGNKDTYQNKNRNSFSNSRFSNRSETSFTTEFSVGDDKINNEILILSITDNVTLTADGNAATVSKYKKNGADASQLASGYSKNKSI